MAEIQVAPYGAWKSPLTSDVIVAENISLGDIAVDGEDIYWLEMRPAEAGRNVIVRRTSDGHTSDVTPSPFNVRTRVHEYGGGAYIVNDGVIYFSNFSDQRLYRHVPGATPEPLTPALDLRFADGIFDRQRNRLICVREDHTSIAPGGQATNTIVSVYLDKENEGEVLVSGNDFYSNPRLSQDGSRLAWLTWKHPNMPWDGTELWVAELQADGSLGQTQMIAGGQNESVFQPEWSPAGTLYFVSDRSGWWNLYRSQTGQIQALHPMEAEFGLPQWVFRMGTYAILAEGQLICSYSQQGRDYLAILDPDSGQFETLAVPYTTIGLPHVVKGAVLFEAGSPNEALALVKLDLATLKIEVLRRSSQLVIDPGYLSVAQSIEFPTSKGQTAYAFYYPPHNRDFVAPPNEKPPLLVKSHGGPTGATDNVLNAGIQFWTSRGFGVLDVNYGGSTGYGRAYRQRLNGQWGVVDSDDCANGARYLVGRGHADGNRLAIDGGSAGGYTTLCVLTFRDDFKAGASYYGVSDLEALAQDTHKFESRYMDSMVGPYPEQRALYLERSPIHHTDKLATPLILLQGLEDKVVPPSQAELMFEAVRAKGLPVAYLPFEGEQHGFRQAKNIKRALEAELYFYAQIFGFDLADPIEPVEIENYPMNSQ